MTAPLLHCVLLLLLYKLVVIVDANTELQAEDGHSAHSSGSFMLNTSHPWWIISTSTSRHPNRGLYTKPVVQTGKSPGNTLRVKDFHYDSPDLQMAFWIWPVPGSVDQFWLVGGKDSERPGYTVYLDSKSRTVWQAFRPEDPDDRFIWKLIPKTSYGDRHSADMDDTTEPHGTSATHYYIVSGPESRCCTWDNPDKMLFVTDTVGVSTWPVDTNDDKATWKLLPVPCKSGPKAWEQTENCDLPEWPAAGTTALSLHLRRLRLAPECSANIDALRCLRSIGITYADLGTGSNPRLADYWLLLTWTWHVRAPYPGQFRHHVLLLLWPSGHLLYLCEGSSSRLQSSIGRLVGQIATLVG